MNKLSWLLYFADVAPSLATFVGVIAGFLTLIAFFIWCIRIGLLVDPAADKDGQSAKIKFTRWLWPLLLCVTCVCYLVPSKQTFYLIAGSEIGEQAIKTPEFAKTRAALNRLLDKIAEPTPAPATNTQEDK